jgi:hypothetical protein
LVGIVLVIPLLTSLLDALQVLLKVIIFEQI